MLIALLPCCWIGLTVNVEQLIAFLAYKAEDNPETFPPDGLITDECVRILTNFSLSNFHSALINIVDIAKCQTCCLSNIGNSASKALKEHAHTECGHCVLLNLLFGLLFTHSVYKVVVHLLFLLYALVMAYPPHHLV